MAINFGEIQSLQKCVLRNNGLVVFLLRVLHSEKFGQKKTARVDSFDFQTISR